MGRAESIAYLALANESLAFMELAIEKRFERKIISNGYYLAHNSAMALLSLFGIESSSHKYTISFINKNYCKENLIPQHLGAGFHFLEEMRKKADYDPLYTFTDLSVAKCVTIAKELSVELGKLIDKELQGSDKD